MVVQCISKDNSFCSSSNSNITPHFYALYSCGRHAEWGWNAIMWNLMFMVLNLTNGDYHEHRIHTYDSALECEHTREGLEKIARYDHTIHVYVYFECQEKHTLSSPNWNGE